MEVEDILEILLQRVRARRHGFMKTELLEDPVFRVAAEELNKLLILSNPNGGQITWQNS